MSSIQKTSEIFQCLSDGIGKISDISKKLTYSKSTIHNILKSLENVGYAVQDPITRQYSLGPKLFNLTANPLNVHQGLIQCAREEMVNLRDIIKETAALQIPLGSQSITVELVETKQTIRMFMKKGGFHPIYMSAVGKILLSQLDDEEVRSLLENIEIKPVTNKTITDKNLLFEDLLKARHEGYSFTVGEYQEGAAAVAVPIKNYTCPVALWVAGPEERIVKVRVNILGHLRNSAKEISKNLEKVFEA